MLDLGERDRGGRGVGGIHRWHRWVRESACVATQGSHGAGMPTVKIPNCPFRFFFYSNEAGEPPHIHAERAGKEAKFWLGHPVSLARNDGFAAHELTQIKRLIIEHEDIIRNTWSRHLG